MAEREGGRGPAGHSVSENGCAVGPMYRERLFSDQSSGSRFFAGEEEGAFTADSA